MSGRIKERIHTTHMKDSNFDWDTFWEEANAIALEKYGVRIEQLEPGKAGIQDQELNERYKECVSAALQRVKNKTK